MKIDLWAAHTACCPGCDNRLLVHGDPRRGDNILCPWCSANLDVDEICGDYREDDSPKALEVERL